MQLLLSKDAEITQSDFIVDISVCLNTGKPMYRLPIQNMEGENYIDVEIGWSAGESSELNASVQYESAQIRKSPPASAKEVEWLNEQLNGKDKQLSGKDAQLSQLMIQLNDMAMELSQEKMKSQQTLERYETQIHKLSESNADLTL